MLLTEYGIVGARWFLGQTKKPNENMYWSHMKAIDIQNNIGTDFDSCIKISCSRHPITKYISAFHHFGDYSRSDALHLKQQGLLHLLKRDFCSYIKNVNLSERSFLSIKGKCCIDHFIRQENFASDIDRILAILGINEARRVALLRNAPSAKRSQAVVSKDGDSDLLLSTVDYLNDENVELISLSMAWDYENMGYDNSIY
jgi:hypothetical protein